jgi:hypothetical protein
VSRSALRLTLATGVVCVLSYGVSADEPRPAAPPQPRTIGDILANPVRDEPVIVSGTVVWRVVGNDYLLDDGTGKLIVDGGPIERHSLDLPIGSAVDITGEVSLGPPGRSEPRSPEVDIFSVTQNDGTVVQVRSGPGPRWASTAD